VREIQFRIDLKYSKNGEWMDIKNLRVLVTEDENFQRSILIRMLKDLGLNNLYEAIDGYSALEIIQKQGNSLDIIICDMNMPGMDGMELIRHLSEQKLKMGIIIASGLDHQLINSIEKMALAYGTHILGIIEKPVTKKELELLFRKYISTQASQKSYQEAPIKTLPTFTKKELMTALKKDEFELFFQPKVEMVSGLVTGVEALARWRHPQQGIILPDDFIPTMEKNGLIEDLTWIMWKKAASNCRAWRDAGLNITVSVNVSINSLFAPTLAENITEIVLNQGCDPTDMIIEVTESATVTRIGSVIENLSRLRMKGFGLSIDDYGTGYSSMQRLLRVSYTELKIDKAFVTNAALEETNRVILESSLKMAKKLMIKSVAEGVESQADWNFLLELGCDMAQGYLISEPLPADQVYNWVLEWTRHGFSRITKQATHGTL